MPSANIVHSLPWPALEDGNLSFPRGSYECIAKNTGQDGQVLVEHKLKEAPFLEKLVMDGKACFGCIVSVPKTGYRRLLLADGNSQSIMIEKDFLGEPPMLQPLLLSLEEFNHIFGQDDGVAPLWHGSEIRIEKGARLVRGSYLRQGASMSHMLFVKLDNDIEENCFEVREGVEDGFVFFIHASNPLFGFLDNPGAEMNLRRSIFIHIISRCLEILAKNYGIDQDGENKWEQYSNLKLLTELLENREITHWTDEGFKPELAATQLYPLHIPASRDEEE